jgi:hypothetical protein
MRSERAMRAPEPPAIETGGRDCFREFCADTREHDPVNAYLLAMANAYFYPFVVAQCIGCDAEDVHRLVSGRLKHWGFAADVRYISRSAFMQYDTQALVAQTDEIVLVVFRGSEMPVGVVGRVVATLRDWLATDADMALTSFADLGPDVEVHSGFHRGFMAVAEEIEAAVCDAVQAGRRLWVTGHSMGGALATLAAPWLCARDLPVAGVYTFGAPMAGGVGLTNLFRTLPIRGFHRYVQAGDPVPALPPRPAVYQHTVPPHVIHPDGTISLAETGYQGPRSLRRHMVQRYCKALYAVLDEAQQRLMPPPPAA